MARTASSARSSVTVDRSPERVDAERAQGQPELECTRGSRELEALVGEVDDAFVDLRVAQVVRGDLERTPERVRVAHEHAAALVRLVQPLVRVERDRIGEREIAERRSAAVGQHGEAAVRRIALEPDVALAADGGELVDRVDGAGARRAAVRDREERQPAGRLVGRHRGCKRRGLEPQIVADRQHAQLVRPEAEHPCRARDRRVRLVGCVDDEVVAHRADERFARTGERGEVRRRAAADERAAGVRRIADPLLEPAEHLELELRRTCGFLPRAGVDVAALATKSPSAPGHVPENGT